MAIHTEDIKNLERAKQLITENCSRHFTIAELSTLCQMGNTRFKKLFKHYTGLGPYAFLKACRMKKAYQLITASTLPIKLVAKQCGFRYLANFCSAFKKEFGITGGELRRSVN